MRTYKAVLWRSTLPLLACLVGTGAPALTAAESPAVVNDLTKGLGVLAKNIQQLLKTENRENDVLAVGQFAGPTVPPATSGPEIARILQGELKKLGLNISDGKKRPTLEIEGKYTDIEGRSTDAEGRKRAELLIRLKARLVERVTDKELQKFEIDIRGEENVKKLLGPTADLTSKVPPGTNDKTKNDEVKKSLGNEPARNEKLKESVENPKVELADNPKANIAKTRIAASSGSPYALEILGSPKEQKELYAPLAATDENGLAFVSIALGQCYALRCYNDSPYDALVQLTIDGVDQFTFSDEQKYPGIIIAAHSSDIIYGWYRNVKRFDAFKITKYSESVAGQLNSEAGVGTITASFSAVWSKEPPPDEPPAQDQVSKSPKIGTGKGAEIAANMQITEVFRGKVRTIISVRYHKSTAPVDLPPGEAPPKDAPPKKDGRPECTNAKGTSRDLVRFNGLRFGSVP
jgi:hypothetical protein